MIAIVIVTATGTYVTVATGTTEGTTATATTATVGTHPTDDDHQSAATIRLSADVLLNDGEAIDLAHHLHSGRQIVVTHRTDIAIVRSRRMANIAMTAISENAHLAATGIANEDVIDRRSTHPHRLLSLLLRLPLRSLHLRHLRQPHLHLLLHRLSRPRVQRRGRCLPSNDRPTPSPTTSRRRVYQDDLVSETTFTSRIQPRVSE